MCFLMTVVSSRIMGTSLRKQQQLQYDIIQQILGIIILSVKTIKNLGLSKPPGSLSICINCRTEKQTRLCMEHYKLKFLSILYDKC